MFTPRARRSASRKFSSILSSLISAVHWKMSPRTAHRALPSQTVASSIPVTISRACGSCWSTPKQFGKPELIEKAQTIFDNAIHAGWDEEYGGLLYFVDAKGLPPEAYEHDMKLWWPHNEILISSMMLYRDTGNEQDLDWFFKTLDYCQKHFSDPAYGEWYGYLRRDGLPTMPPTKGSTFKGPFHLPRCLIQLDQMMTELEARA